MKIFTLFGSIFVESDKANESMDKTDKKARNIAGSLGNGIKKAAGWSAAIVGASAGVAVAVFKAGEKFAENTDRIDKMSQKLGLSRKGFQEWDFVLSQSGASIDSMKAGMVKLTNSVDELKQGTGAGAEAFERLGISAEELEGLSQEEVFEKTVKALQGVADAGERAAIGNDLLGKSAVEMAPLLNAGAGSLDDMKAQANDLGLILGDDAVDAGVKFTDTMDQIKRSIGAMSSGLMEQLMPILQSFMEFVQDNMPMIKEVLTGVFDSLLPAIENLLPFFMQLVEELLPPLVELFTSLASNILPILIETATTLVGDVLPILIDVFIMLVETVLPPLVEIFMYFVKDVLPILIELFTEIMTNVMPIFMDVFKSLTETVLPPLLEIFKIFIDNVLPIIMELFDQFVEIVLPPLLDLINLLVKDILPPLLDVFLDLAKEVLPLVMTIFEAMMPVIEPAMKMIAAVIKTVMALITGDWEGAWEGIQDFITNFIDYATKAVEGFAEIFGGIFQGISDVVTGIWDGMVGGIKSGINFIISGINTFIAGVNKLKIPNWVPIVGGKGISLPMIPQLAEGGDLTRSGKFIVGENGPEMFEAKAGARVTPLPKSGITIGPEAFAGAIIMDDYGVDRLMTRVMERATALGV